MICKNCGNKEGFLVKIEDYKPLEMWEFSEGVLTRYCQKDSGEVDTTVVCAACDSEDIDTEGADLEAFSDRPLVILSEGEWGDKNDQYKKPAKEEKPE